MIFSLKGTNMEKQEYQKVTPKLVYYRVKLSDFKKSTLRYCLYCGKEVVEFISVISQNEKVFEFFNIDKIGTKRHFNLCFECFEKLHDLLEEIEQEGYQVLDENEFPDLDKELSEFPEDGTDMPKSSKPRGRPKKLNEGR
jgi:hypothetical protein